MPNGLTVLLQESHKSPVISVQMWVKTGSADERRIEQGISHFIEHLVFKGTRKFKVGEIAASVEGSGGELNAYTSFDQTVFYVTISKHFLRSGLEAISEMMGFPAFDPVEIDNEREVVIEEIKRGNDSLGRKASQLMFSTQFKKHPYGVPVIGFERVIRKVSRKTLIDYYRSRYVPSNMFLVVSGDFETRLIKPLVKEYFGEFEKFKLRRVVRTKEPKQARPAVVIKQEKFEEANFFLSWKVPGIKHADVPALDVLALILGQGESSRLIQELRVRQPLVNHVFSSSFTLRDYGLFAISAGLNPEKFGEVLENLGTQLIEFMKVGPSWEEMKKAWINLQSEEFYGLETVDGLARKLGTMELMTGDLKFFDKYLKRVMALKPADIVRVARKYLDPDHLSFSMVMPGQPGTSNRPQAARKEFARWHKIYSKQFKSIMNEKRFASKRPNNASSKLLIGDFSKKSSRQQNQTLTFTLPGGGRLLVRPNFETPVISVRSAFLGGLRLESKNQSGLTDLTSRSWSAGTSSLTETQIQERMDALASGLSAFGGRNTIGLALETLAPFAKEVGSVFLDVMTRPSFPDSVLEREKYIMLENLKNREDNPAYIASTMFAETLFQDHPYARDLAGTKETVPLLTRPQVTDHFQKMRRAANFVVTVAGATDVDYWRELFANAAQAMPDSKFLEIQHHHKNLERDLQVYRELKKEQTHIVLGFKGITFRDPDGYALQLLQSILSGQGGRLFIELRDKASLAYSVAPLRMEGIDTGYFGAYIGCSPEKSVRSIAMMKKEFEKLCESLVPDDELMRSKRYLIGRHDIDLQKNSTLASGILFADLYNQDHDEIFHFAERLNAVTSEDVRRVARRIFSQHHVCVAVGATSPFSA